jgi:uncharacterized SAM-binding protein YcdF (DUF218 family)
VIRRIFSLLLIIWLFGQVWFAVTLPGRSDIAKTDGIVVLTGGPGRFQRGLELLKADRAERLLVSGVHPKVKQREFIAAQHVPATLLKCCIDLGREAIDTVSNAQETADWVRKHDYKTIRLVTTDWHMRRAQFEIERALGPNVQVVPEGVRSSPGFVTLFKEYHKYLARRISVALGF